MLDIGRQVDALVITLLHPLHKTLRAHDALFFCTKKDKDETSWRTLFLEMASQFEQYGIAAGIVVSTWMDSYRVWTTRAGGLATHAQMIVMGSHHYILMF